MTEPAYAIIGFISTDSTRNVLEKECPSGMWLPKPSARDLPILEKDIVLVLHKSQPTDDGQTVNDYSCFDRCVAGLELGKWASPMWVDHLAWLKTHESRVKVILLTSGADVSDARISAAGARLANRHITVLGWNVTELARRLSSCTSLDPVSKFIACISSETEEEYALQLLSALLPFGWLWETHSESQNQGLRSVASHIEEDLFVGFERAVVKVFRTALENLSEPQLVSRDYEQALRVLNQRIGNIGSREDLIAKWRDVGECECPPSSLEQTLSVLTQTTDLDQWNKRLSVLSDSLLG